MAISISQNNFAGDTPSLYHNLGGANFETPLSGGLAAHQYLGWGAVF